ncbi:hypothetical protein DMO16_09995 [Fictibacillus sp. S7]|nr:hypothetical protein DMO16_09995 [Fictibacillus sp. S7]
MRSLAGNAGLFDSFWKRKHNCLVWTSWEHESSGKFVKEYVPALLNKAKLKEDVIELKKEGVKVEELWRVVQKVSLKGNAI